MGKTQALALGLLVLAGVASVGVLLTPDEGQLQDRAGRVTEPTPNSGGAATRDGEAPASVEVAGDAGGTGVAEDPVTDDGAGPPAPPDSTEAAAPSSEDPSETRPPTRAPSPELLEVEALGKAVGNDMARDALLAYLERDDEVSAAAVKALAEWEGFDVLFAERLETVHEGVAGEMLRQIGAKSDGRGIRQLKALRGKLKGARAKQLELALQRLDARGVAEVGGSGGLGGRARRRSRDREER